MHAQGHWYKKWGRGSLLKAPPPLSPGDGVAEKCVTDTVLGESMGPRGPPSASRPHAPLGGPYHTAMATKPTPTPHHRYGKGTQTPTFSPPIPCVPRTHNGRKKATVDKLQIQLPAFSAGPDIISNVTYLGHTDPHCPLQEADTNHQATLAAFAGFTPLGPIFHVCPPQVTSPFILLPQLSIPAALLQHNCVLTFPLFAKSSHFKALLKH